MQGIYFLIFFPLILTFFFGIGLYLKYRDEDKSWLNQRTIKYLLIVYGVLFLATLPYQFHEDKDNLQLLIHSTSSAFTLEYLKDNYAKTLLILPVFLIAVFLIERLLPHYKIQPHHPRPKTLFREFVLTLLSFLFFAPAVFLIAFLNRAVSIKVMLYGTSLEQVISF